MTTFLGSLSYLPQALADPAMLRWIGALVLLAVMLLLLREFVQTVREDPPHVETHWGGIGGGLGGWRISPSLAYLVAVIAFGAMFTTVLLRTIGDGTSASGRPAAEKKETDEKALERKEIAKTEGEKRDAEKKKKE